MGTIRSRPVDMSGDTAKFVQEKISANPLVVFSKSTCPYCDLAKNILHKYKATFETVELNQRPDCDEIQAVLGELTGARTVPRVFIGGKCIGGGSDTEALDKEGTLEGMLKSAGVKLA